MMNSKSMLFASAAAVPVTVRQATLTQVDGKPAVYRTKNGGRSWQRQAKGFPAARAWWTVKRHALAVDGLQPLGLYFGTMQGQVWPSRNEGGRWAPIAGDLPAVISVTRPHASHPEARSGVVFG